MKSNKRHSSEVWFTKLLVPVLAAGSLSMPASVLAADDGTINIGFISPRTGPLASFGKTDGFILEQARIALADGMTIQGKHYKVNILDRDSQSDPARAGQLAKELINQGVDLMLAVSTPEVINPVADASEAAEVPMLSTVMPWEAWYYGRGAKPGEPSPFKWTYHFGFGAGEFYKTYMSQWDLLETNKRVGVMYPNDADGNAIRGALVPRFKEAGYTVIDPGAYETGTTDFSSQIATFKAEKVEIINTFPIPPDFAAFWRQSAQQGLHRQVKIIQVAKTGLFPADIEVLGSLGPKIASAAYWHKSFPYSSSLTGQNGTQLADLWEKESGEQWTQQLGATLSLLDAGTEALKRATDPNSREAVRDAIATLNTTTIGGKVDFTSGPVPNVSPGPIIGAQWVKGTGKHQLDYVITENVTDPNVPVTHPLLQYNR
ncbi:ABC transporter substrate-binding protein [Marinomonas algicola]|uniref:ABC transporter substrate-binding protein n=1 Tax=Marinomonas algicola TaxID=2773454 RepID=UPI00174AB056|nr:ABC transporter substrate-binding protein [Marinomonas algicola]